MEAIFFNSLLFRNCVWLSKVEHLGAPGQHQDHLQHSGVYLASAARTAVVHPHHFHLVPHLPQHLDVLPAQSLQYQAVPPVIISLKVTWRSLSVSILVLDKQEFCNVKALGYGAVMLIVVTVHIKCVTHMIEYFIYVCSVKGHELTYTGHHLPHAGFDQKSRCI